jgi:hypothetical protein
VTTSTATATSTATTAGSDGVVGEAGGGGEVEGQGGLEGGVGMEGGVLLVILASSLWWCVMPRDGQQRRAGTACADWSAGGSR